MTSDGTTYLIPSSTKYGIGCIISPFIPSHLISSQLNMTLNDEKQECIMLVALVVSIPFLGAMQTPARSVVKLGGKVAQLPSKS